MKIFYIFLCILFHTVEARRRFFGARYIYPLPDEDAVTTTKPRPDKNYCYIEKSNTWNESCQYVQQESDKCEGGGYFSWTKYVMCQDSTPEKVLIIFAGVIYMLYLFVAVSTAADDFFSPNVAGIVAHLGISESIAGVTFMAFGNGAPDIFGSIASVLSTPKPKAGFAIGELLGAGIFVTSCVTATIVFTKPFKAAVFETIRDLLFYLCALSWILFVLLHSSTVETYQPLVFLLIYGIYVGTVILSHFLHKRRKAKREESMKSSNRNSVHPNIDFNDADAPPQTIISAAVEKIATANGNFLNGMEKLEVEEPIPKLSELRRHSFSIYGRRHSNVRSRRSTRVSNDKVNSLHVGNSNPAFELPQENHAEDTEEDMIWVGHHLMSGAENRSRAQSIIPPAEIHSAKSLMMDIFNHVLPISSEDWTEANYLEKFLLVLKAPLMVAFCLTIPHVDLPWSKPVAILHAFFAPQFFLFAIQAYTVQPISALPGLYLYMFILSAVLIALLIFFTSVADEPRFYKASVSYIGFLMSISWIYLIANEVVSVVTMIGVISQISHEVLGLTILAWANSIGDLIADVAVVKQGYSNMALAAAIGGPLFNLLIGFGLPFSIARISGTPVHINFSTINHILVCFLGLSLSFTLAALFIQRFYLRRVYAGSLLAIYAAFIVMVILAETNVFTWGGGDN